MQLTYIERYRLSLRGEIELASPSGNRTPVSRVTGGDTDHYTNEDTRCLAGSSAVR